MKADKCYRPIQLFFLLNNFPTGWISIEERDKKKGEKILIVKEKKKRAPTYAVVFPTQQLDINREKGKKKE